MQKWLNKIAVVTGAGSGIGAACSQALIENGMKVIGLDLHSENIDKMRYKAWPTDQQKQSQLHALRCDVRQESEIVSTFERIVREHGPISVLVNNAGIKCETELLRENNTKELRDVVDTNLMGVALCTREAFKTMSKEPQALGHVFLINSILGHKILLFEDFSTNIYPPIKHALKAMTEIYRHEFLLYKTKTKVTSISPGVVRTNIFTEKDKKYMTDFPYLEPSDIADAMIYCLQTPPHVQIHEMIIKPMGEKV